MANAGWQALCQAVGGRRVGLVTGPTGWVGDLGHLADRFHERGLLAALFAPQHGVWGARPAGEPVVAARDPRTGVPVHSLYGAATRPSPAMLADVDIVVGCLQDVSARPYTFAQTLAGCLQSCTEQGKPMIVFDRPTPLGGAVCQGNVAAGVFATVPVPMRFGLTHGELLRLIAHERGWDAELTVVPVLDGPRGRWADEWALPWLAPSPNLPTLASCLCFPASVVLEGTGASEGRGTTRPFELVGAPWCDAAILAEELNSRRLPGLLARPAAFIPTFSKHAGDVCRGVQLHVTDRLRFDPPRVGLHLLAALWRHWPEALAVRRASLDARFDDPRVWQALLDGTPPDELWADWRGALRQFRQRCVAAAAAPSDWADG